MLVNTRRQPISYEPPTQWAELPPDIVDTLNGYSLSQFQHVARYTETLAEHKEREARLEVDTDEKDIEERPDELSDDIPSKATLTIKEINDNRYYWQWREGGQIKSNTKGQSTLVKNKSDIPGNLVTM